MDKEETKLTDENDYISIDRRDTPRPSSNIYDPLTSVRIENNWFDHHYVIFNKLIENFFNNHHGDAKLDTRALDDIIDEATKLINDKNQQAINFKKYCITYIAVIDSLKEHPPLD